MSIHRTLPRYAASNPAGYQTAAQVTAVLANYLPLGGGTLNGALVGTAVTFSGNAQGALINFEASR